MEFSNIKKLCLTILACAAMIPSLAYANLAANTKITNTATVNFKNTANVAQTAVTSSVAFTINLIPAAPLLRGGGFVFDPKSENEGILFAFHLYSNANGPDSYDLTYNVTNTQINATDPAIPDSPRVTLGATTLAVDALPLVYPNQIWVPYDGDSTENQVNGIQVNDAIVIGGGDKVYHVKSIDKTDSANSNLVLITLEENLLNDLGDTTVFPAGAIVGESQSFFMFLLTGTTIEAPHVFGTHVLDLTANSVTDASMTTSVSNTINVRKPFLTVTKYVRNATDSTFNVAGTGDATIGGVDYFTDGITGNPGDTMEYAVVIENTREGAGLAKKIIVSDQLPMFTSLVDTSVHLLPAITGDISSASFPPSPLNVTANNDAAEYDALTNALTIYAGKGGVDSFVKAAGGQLTQGQRSVIRFQVTVD